MSFFTVDVFEWSKLSVLTNFMSVLPLQLHNYVFIESAIILSKLCTTEEISKHVSHVSSYILYIHISFLLRT